jgi:hypothetical protein
VVQEEEGAKGVLWEALAGGVVAGARRPATSGGRQRSSPAREEERAGGRRIGARRVARELTDALGGLYCRRAWPKRAGSGGHVAESRSGGGRRAAAVGAGEGGAAREGGWEKEVVGYLLEVGQARENLLHGGIRPATGSSEEDDDGERLGGKTLKKNDGGARRENWRRQGRFYSLIGVFGAVAWRWEDR